MGIRPVDLVLDNGTRVLALVPEEAFDALFDAKSIIDDVLSPKPELPKTNASEDANAECGIRKLTAKFKRLSIR